MATTTRRSSAYTLEEKHLAWQGKNDGRIAKVFILDDPRGVTHGRFYIIAEISQPSQDGEFLLTSLSRDLFEKGFSPHDSLEEKFEEFVTRANSILKNVGSETSSTWFGNTHIVLMLTLGKKLYVSTVGNPRVLLMRGEGVTDIIKRSRDRAEALATRFEHVISGEMYPGDTVLTVTPGLFELFSREHFEHIVKKYRGFPLSDLERILKDREETADVPFASVLLRLEERPRPATTQEPGISPLRNGHIARIVHIIRTRVKSVFRRLPRSVPPPSFPSLNLRSLLPRSPFKVISSRFSFVKSFMNLRGALTIVGALVIIVITGLLIFAQHEKTNEELRSRIDALRANINDAENALVFNDRDRAQTHIIEARMLLANIKDGATSLPEAQQLQRSLGKLEDKLLGTMIIQNPTVIWEIKDNLGTAPNGLFFEDETLFAYSENQAIMYRRGEPQKLLFLPVSARISKAPGVFLASSSRFLWYEAESGVHSFDPTTETDNILDGIPEKLQVADIQYYRTFLYVLTNDGKIRKYRQDKTKFTDVGEWLKEPLEIPPPPSFSIDGAIYVVGDAHTVVKLTNGRVSEHWSIPLDLSDAKIVASESLSHVYIVAKRDNSILQLSKEGKITKRYKSDAFNSLQDIWVNERENKIAVLDDFLVYEISL